MTDAGCRVCGGKDGHRHFLVREMFFGSREPFDYFECGDCGTVQISDIPGDLARHYPDDYYSFAGSRARPASRIEVALRRMRSDARLTGEGAIGRLLSRLSKRTPACVGWFAGIPVNTGSRIVDVGCGSGALLLSMQRDGFRQLSGLDPFIAETIRYRSGLTIHRRSLAEDAGSYDLIMMNHSFEHMPDPVAAMTHIADHLAPGGRALVRLPIAGGHAWRTYRENWFQLDAPRHLVIPTVRAMHLLAEGAGMEVERCFFDSKADQFLASEAYRMDVPMAEHKHLPPRGEDEMNRLKSMAARLNREGDGDQGGFVLRRKPGESSS
ncbi:MAG: class I SAM-dependent methyltransferase [Candidatus Nitricoxidivorans perseverans]|uniref:Class I SAM-dependent methyltransferase n=1 Tax=Candidatus Nitricoxidivorans perseverans TaxID=2975601 RepID=A0AA49FJW5_9PROT|nr:MAG: class I SAM-dependent methyltransferase [Candidatus Nitricoxidivorans perseverans]